MFAYISISGFSNNLIPTRNLKQVNIKDMFSRTNSLASSEGKNCAFWI